MTIYEEYNPLDYDHLTENLVRELMGRKPQRLPLDTEFVGAGVYALFYNGDFEAYKPVSGTDRPIYVGKAVPEGARKGRRSTTPAMGKPLFNSVIVSSVDLATVGHHDRLND